MTSYSSVLLPGFLLIASFPSRFLAVAPQLIDDSALIRDKRGVTFIYLCGERPNQYYSTNPCRSAPPKCSNGGRLVGVGCTASVQCTPFHTGITQCIQGCCCTVPERPTPTPPSTRHFGVCYHGQLSEVRCSERGQCASGQTCINGLCCTTTGQEFKYACGGEAALGSCSGGRCGEGVCTSSNYCCECPVGVTAGRCSATNSCPFGYSCHSTGFCCASCPSRAMPYGACRNGTCGGGRRCYPGNICC